MLIKIKNKQILMPDIRLYQGEKNVSTLSFIMDNAHDGISLSDCSPYIKTTEPGGAADKRPMTKSPYLDSYLKLDWKIPSDVTFAPGYLKIQIVLEDEFGGLIYSTDIVTVKVEGFAAQEELSSSYPDVLWSLENRIKETESSIPTKLSELQNDTGYVNSAAALDFSAAEVASRIETHNNSLYVHQTLFNNIRSEINAVEDEIAALRGELSGYQADRHFIDLTIYKDIYGGIDTERLNADLASAAADKPCITVRADIVFYYSDETSPNITFQNIILPSNTNYYYLHSKERGDCSFRLEGLNNCNFYNFNMSGLQEDGQCTLRNCNNLSFFNCTFINGYQDAVNASGSNQIYFENCTLGCGKAYAVARLKDTSSTYNWIMFDNCIFAIPNNSNYKTVSLLGSSNSRLIVTLKNCFYEDLTDTFYVAKQSGKIFQIKGTQI